MSSQATTAVQARNQRDDMANISLETSDFIRSFEQSEKTTEERIEDLLKNPDDEDAVHDVRTAIRRLDAHIELLPKKVRKETEVKQVLKKHDEVMKKSAEVRDLDVIKGKVSRQGKDPDKAAILKRIEKRRKKLTKGMTDAASEARKLRVSSWAFGISQDRLQERLEKVVTKLIGKVSARLPEVARHPDNLDELHALRVDGRKLRYTLEIAMNEGSPELVRLKKWQDALGSIHDLDVFTAFLGVFKSPFARNLQREMKGKREREFREFADSVIRES